MWKKLMNMSLCLLVLSVLASTMVYASPAVNPYKGGPTQSEIDAQLLREKEALPPYLVKNPQELWKEGKNLFAKKQYGEGIVLMRASQKASPDAQQHDSLAKYEADLIRQKKKAQDLRQLGKDWQVRGNISKAVAAFQASLHVWPDTLLELHVANLNSPNSAIESNSEMVELVPCAILDVSTIEVPADFSLEYAPGTDKSDRMTVTRAELFADGRLVRYSKSRISYHQAGPPRYTTAPKRVPEMAVRRLYAATQACAFHELGSHKKNTPSKWGTPWELTLKADGVQQSASVLGVFVSRFEYVRLLFNKTIDGY